MFSEDYLKIPQADKNEFGSVVNTLLLKFKQEYINFV